MERGEGRFPERPRKFQSPQTSAAALSRTKDRKDLRLDLSCPDLIKLPFISCKGRFYEQIETNQLIDPAPCSTVSHANSLIKALHIKIV